MAFVVVRVLPSPPPPAPEPEPATLACWRLAQVVTGAVGLASAWLFFASLAGMVVGFVTCGEEWPVFWDSLGENCLVFRASLTLFCISSSSMAVVSQLSGLLRACVARCKAKEEEGAGSRKPLGCLFIIEHLVPLASFFLLIVGTLLRLTSAEGSLMKTISYVFLCLGVGVMVLICVVGFAWMVVGMCWMVAITATTVWECCRTVETKAQSPEEKEL